MSAIIIETIQALLFGETWYIGLLVFLILAIGFLKMWKYAGAIIIPMIIILETQYYDRVASTPELVWPMAMLLFLALGIALYTLNLGVSKRGDD